MAIIQAENLTKIYKVADKTPGLAGTLRHFVRRNFRNIEAVKNLSCTIAAGEIVGFLGPNGAGKTTTLKMLTGLIQPSAGHIDVAGYRPFNRDHAFLKTITLVMGQKQQLIWDLPTLDSIRINAAVYEIPEQEYQRRMHELAAMLQLEEQLQQPVRKLSLGERMKAELLAALLHHPAILFLDEPTLGLDINAQAAVREFLREYNRRYGATILLTSHYMADIKALCPRILLIHKGQLMYDGSLQSVLDNFAPYREVKVELAETQTQDCLKSYGEVVSMQGRLARLVVRREILTETVARLLQDFQVVDLTVTDPPIEEIIGRIFHSGSLE